MNRVGVVLVAVSLLAAACGEGTPSATTAPTTTTISTTTTVAPTSTAATTTTTAAPPTTITTTVAPTTTVATTTTVAPTTTVATTTTVAPTTTAAPTTAAPTTTTTATTVPTDVTPPSLVITDPIDGATVTSRTYRFRGTTDPGATVTAWDRWDAAVDAEGAWSLILVLTPGDNVARFVATDPAGTTTEVRTTVRYHPPLVLRADGLGAVSFGDPVDEVLTTLTKLLGPPEEEEIQISPDIDRIVRWTEPDLYLQFTYWDYFDAAPEPPQPMPDGPVFHYYLTTSDAFATAAGITVGATVRELRAVYPDARFEDPCDESSRGFVVDPPAGWLLLPLFGRLDGVGENAASRILSIGAGWDRTPC